MLMTVLGRTNCKCYYLLVIYDSLAIINTFYEFNIVIYRILMIATFGFWSVRELCDNLVTVFNTYHTFIFKLYRGREYYLQVQGHQNIFVQLMMWKITIACILNDKIFLSTYFVFCCFLYTTITYKPMLLMMGYRQ